MRNSKKPKSKYNPSKNKIPITVEDVNAIERKLFKWSAVDTYIDYDIEEWGWGGVGMKQFFNNCLKYLQSYEEETWMKLKEIERCHPVRLKDIVPKAQKKIVNRHGDMDDLWQVKAEGECRLFGRKDGRTFYLIWHDEHHTVYPKGK